jgi:excisionase family DNA binding protein
MSASDVRVSSRYLDINDLAEQLGMSTATLYRWRSDGTDMPIGFMIGSRVRWKQETVDAWIAAQEAKAGAA